MYVVTVAPLKRSVKKEDLSYFSAQNIPIGYVVTVPIRKQKVPALVLSTKDLVSSKTDVKASAFKLKKVLEVHGPSVFSPAFFDGCTRAAEYYAAPLGGIIDALIPRHFIERYGEISTHTPEPLQSTSNLRQEKLVLQAQSDERLSFYKTNIREAFARKESVFLCVPTVHDLHIFEEFIVKGIEQYTVLLHGDLTQKEQIKRYNKIIESEHPVLIMATPSYLFTYRKDITTYILESESANAYKQIKQPYIDIRTFIELFTAVEKKKLIFGDTLLRTETIWRAESNQLSEVRPMNFRTAPSVEYTVIPPEETNEEDKKPYTFFSTEIRELLQYVKENKLQLFFFNLRKGLATTTICNDCRAPLTCRRCDASLVLFESKSGRYFSCPKCGETKDARVTCAECESWNLVPLGAGTDAIVRELQEYDTDVPIVHVSKQATKTSKQAAQAVKTFYKSKPGILVGTELALYHLNDPIDYTAVISFDSLFSIPSFRINERIAQLLIGLGTLTKEHVLIQTKHPKNKAIEALEQKNLSTFYRNEIGTRQQLSYPPFSTLIKITRSGTEADVAAAEAHCQEQFAAYQPKTYQAFTKRVRGKHVLHTLIKLPKEQWSLPELSPNGSIDATLSGALRALPPSYTIDIDPIDLL